MSEEAIEKKLDRLQADVENLKHLVTEVMSVVKDIQLYQWHGNDHWMNIDDLCNYIPSHPAKQTLYNWLYHYDIPAYRIPGMGKNLMFLQSEIDECLLKNRISTSKTDDRRS